jgi:hypothetical protein
MWNIRNLTADTSTGERYAIIIGETATPAIIEPGQVLSTAFRWETFEDSDSFYARFRHFADKWQPGIAVEVGQILHYEVDDKLYEVIQAHTTQSDWTPDIVPALFNVIHEPLPGEDYPPWVQPTGAHDAYKIGDRVTHNGFNWECVAGDANGNNVWEPGVYGWVQI